MGPAAPPALPLRFGGRTSPCRNQQPEVLLGRVQSMSGERPRGRSRWPPPGRRWKTWGRETPFSSCAICAARSFIPGHTYLSKKSVSSEGCVGPSEGGCGRSHILDFAAQTGLPCVRQGRPVTWGKVSNQNTKVFHPQKSSKQGLRQVFSPLCSQQHGSQQPQKGWKHPRVLVDKGQTRCVHPHSGM